MKLPPLTWTNVIALSALAATIIGAAVLTLMSWAQINIFAADADRLISELVRDPKARPEVGQALVTIYDSMSWSFKMRDAGILVVLLSLGLAITPRHFKGKGLGFEGEFGGGDEGRAAQATADAAQSQADEIKGAGE